MVDKAALAELVVRLVLQVLLVKAELAEPAVLAGKVAWTLAEPV